MSGNAIDIAASLTALTAAPRGLRTDCAALLEALQDGIGPLFGLIYMRPVEDAPAEVLAVSNLDATGFRRLEERLERTALMRVFDLSETTRLLINDEPTLDLLARPDTAGELICVPVMTASRVIGAVAAAFDKKEGRVPSDAIRLLEITASLVAALVRSAESRGDESRRLVEENRSLKQELKKRYDLSQLIGNSGPMRSVIDKVTQISRSNATVLLQGSSGTGKGLIAQAIHHNSLRSKRPFVKVSCGSIPDSAIDIELFGSDGSRGQVDEAEGGTLFIDEIGDLPHQTQLKLLRVLQDREFDRVGGVETVRCNVRVIASASRDLEELVAEGLLREDLFYRLNVFTIFLPPLRGRKSDILLLTDHFLQKYSREYDKNILRISTPAIDMLTAYHFPGNVRELENAIETAVLATREAVIHAHHLPPTLQTAEQSGTATRMTLQTAVSAFERDMISDALKSTRGNVAKAAVMLDSTERILGYKIKKYGILPRRFK